MPTAHRYRLVATSRYSEVEKPTGGREEKMPSLKNRSIATAYGVLGTCSVVLNLAKFSNMVGTNSLNLLDLSTGTYSCRSYHVIES